MELLKTYKVEIDTVLMAFFDDYLCEVFSEAEQGLWEGTKYAVMLGGKRIRPILGLLCFEVLSNENTEISRKEVIKNLISIELIHAYSLVHDDLPSLDNDILRRGQDSVWKKYGEADAILIGDNLLTLAFDNLSEVASDCCIKKLIKILAKSSGINGMIGGQIRDMKSENKIISERELQVMHQKKTGALLVASSQFGAILAQASDEKFEKITQFAQKVGLAFQIKDDLLDREGDGALVGKTLGKDIETKGFVAILGLDESKKRLNSLIEEASEIAQELGSEQLVTLAQFIGTREK